MPIWSRLQEPGIDHYADLPAAEAWARNALALASEENERRLSGSGADRDEQALILTRSIDALGSAYRCANLSPPTEPTWRAILADAYGPIGEGGTVVSDASAGWIARQARDVFRAVTGQVGTSFKTYARLWLTAGGRGETTAITNDAVQVLFDPSLAWTGRAHPDGAACADPFGDWECVAWAAAPAGDILLLPAAVWSLGLVRLAAQAIIRDVRGWTLAALRAGAQPIVDGIPPNDPDLDIASAVRPPVVVPVPVPVPVPGPTRVVTTPAPAPQPITSRDVFTFGPVLIGAGLIALVLFGQSVRPARSRR